MPNPASAHASTPGEIDAAFATLRQRRAGAPKRRRLSTFQRTSLARCLPLAAAARRPRAVPVFYPGEIEYLREQERRKIGIEIEDATWDKLRSLAAEYKIAGELGLT